MEKLQKNWVGCDIPTSESLVHGVIGLVSLPEVCIRISEMVDDSRYSASRIGKVISQDAALTARLLKIVNSALYGFPAKVETVSRAVTIVGHGELKELVVAATVSNIFEKISTDLIDIDLFWRHGIYTGIISKIIAKRCSVLHAERLFIAGLLHDIGKLVMAYKLPELLRESKTLAEELDINPHLVEQKIFSYDHAEVGCQLMRAWGFPESHQNTTKFHHDPLASENYVLESAIIYFADRVAHLAEVAEYDASNLHDIPIVVWELTKMSDDSITEVLLAAREQFIEALQLFRPSQQPSDHYAA